MKSVKIESIKVNLTESINNNLVQDLVNSIKEIGLINAIVLTPSFELVAGRHRLEACKQIGWDEIPVNIVTLDELRMRLAAIDEDLIRKQLTALEEAEFLSERKDIYIKLHPETIRGLSGALGKHGGARDKKSFANDVASKTGQSGRNVNRKIYLVKALYQEIRDLIRNTKIADSMTEMKKLNTYPIDTQKELVELIQLGKAKTIAEANNMLNESSDSENIEKGKFEKSTKLLENALKGLIDGGGIQDLIESIPETKYLSFKEDALTDLKTLQKLQERLKEAISIFEGGLSKLEASKFVVLAENQEIALVA